MQQANVASHIWEATGKEKERQVYDSIEQSLDQKRRFRPEVGELGYVGGDYTKKASADRAEYDEAMKRSAEKTRQALGAMGYARAEDFLFKWCPWRRVGFCASALGACGGRCTSTFVDDVARWLRTVLIKLSAGISPPPRAPPQPPRTTQDRGGGGAGGRVLRLRSGSRGRGPPRPRRVQPYVAVI
eukprot:2560464-Prymnesium_polylepis.1